MALSLLRLAERHYQQTVSFADGSRMGKRGPRRHRGIRVSLGKLAAGRASRLCQPLEKRAGASRSLCDKRIRALEHGRQRARMVRRLVRRQLLQLLSQSKSARTKRWHAKGFAGWFLEASHQGESKRGALEHSAAVPIRRLRFSNRPFSGALRRRSRKMADQWGSPSANFKSFRYVVCARQYVGTIATGSARVKR